MAMLADGHSTRMRRWVSDLRGQEQSNPRPIHDERVSWSPQTSNLAALYAIRGGRSRSRSPSRRTSLTQLNIPATISSKTREPVNEGGVFTSIATNAAAWPGGLRPGRELKNKSPAYRRENQFKRENLEWRKEITRRYSVKTKISHVRGGERSVRLDAEFCENCPESERKAAQLHCDKCDAKFCTPCSTAIHRAPALRRHTVHTLEAGSDKSVTRLANTPAAKLKSSHSSRQPSSATNTPLPINTPPSIVTRACDSHPSYSCDVFCRDCATVICTRCFLSGPHTGHNVCTVEEAVVRAEQWMRRSLSVARHQYSTAQRAVERGQACTSDLLSAIESVFRSLGMALLQRKEELQAEVRRAVSTLHDGADANPTGAHENCDSPRFSSAVSPITPAPGRISAAASAMPWQHIPSGGTKDAGASSLSSVFSCIRQAIESAENALQSASMPGQSSLGSDSNNALRALELRPAVENQMRAATDTFRAVVPRLELLGTSFMQFSPQHQDDLLNLIQSFGEVSLSSSQGGSDATVPTDNHGAPFITNHPPQAQGRQPAAWQPQVFGSVNGEPVQVQGQPSFSDQLAEAALPLQRQSHAPPLLQQQLPAEDEDERRPPKACSSMTESVWSEVAALEAAASTPVQPPHFPIAPSAPARSDTGLLQHAGPYVGIEGVDFGQPDYSQQMHAPVAQQSYFATISDPALLPSAASVTARGTKADEGAEHGDGSSGGEAKGGAEEESVVCYPSGTDLLHQLVGADTSVGNTTMVSMSDSQQQQQPPLVPLPSDDSTHLGGSSGTGVNTLWTSRLSDMISQIGQLQQPPSVPATPSAGTSR